MDKFSLWHVKEQGRLHGWAKSARQAYCQQLVPVNISKSARVLHVTLYRHRGSQEVNREGGMKYFYENQLKPMLLSVTG